MTAYVVRRLCYTVPIVFGVILALFLIFNVVGGNPVRAMLGKLANTKMVRDLEHGMGLDLPLIVNLDAWTAEGRRARARTTLEHLATAGAPPERLAFGPEQAGDLQQLYDDPRAAVPTLVAVLLDPAAPPHLRGWADLGLEHVIGEKFRFRADAAPAVQERALKRWQGWWERRNDRVAFAPAWRHVLQSQFFHFLAQAATFDFGRSSQRKQGIAEMIRQGAPPSLAITVPGFVLGTVLSVLLALVCAFRRAGVLDRSIVVLAVLGMSITMLAYVIAGQYLLSYKLGLFPIQGFRSPWVPYVALPVILLVVVELGPDLRFFRTAILDEVGQDYVRTARAKGVSNRAVMLRHVLKNAMIPIITHLVIAIPFLFMGSLLLERFFGIPGLGSTMVDGIFNADWPVVRAFTYIFALLYIVGNLATDLCYALVDPRISLR